MPIAAELRLHILPILEEILHALPPGAAELSENHARNGDPVFRLIPRNKHAAEIWIHVDSCGLIDFGFGDCGSGWEMFLEGAESRWHEDSLRLRAFCEAVIQGNCEFSSGFISQKGTIVVAGKRMSISSFFHMTFLPKTKKYKPYSD